MNLFCDVCGKEIEKQIFYQKVCSQACVKKITKWKPTEKALKRVNSIRDKKKKIRECNHSYNYKIKPKKFFKNGLKKAQFNCVKCNNSKLIGWKKFHSKKYREWKKKMKLRSSLSVPNQANPSKFIPKDRL